MLRFYFLFLFLHGIMENEVYMDLSLGFEDNLNDEKVCKLRKSMD